MEVSTSRRKCLLKTHPPTMLGVASPIMTAVNVWVWLLACCLAHMLQYSTAVQQYNSTAVLQYSSTAVHTYTRTHCLLLTTYWFLARFLAASHVTGLPVLSQLVLLVQSYQVSCWLVVVPGSWYPLAWRLCWMLLRYCRLQGRKELARASKWCLSQNLTGLQESIGVPWWQTSRDLTNIHTVDVRVSKNIYAYWYIII